MAEAIQEGLECQCGYRGDSRRGQGLEGIPFPWSMKPVKFDDFQYDLDLFSSGDFPIATLNHQRDSKGTIWYYLSLIPWEISSKNQPVSGRMLTNHPARGN